MGSQGEDTADLVESCGHGRWEKKLAKRVGKVTEAKTCKEGVAREKDLEGEG
jgi:hypothetical protein